MIIDSIRDYIKQCPFLEEFNNAIRVNVNYLDSEIDTYSIEEVPTQPIIKRYVNGDTLRQYDFIFTSKEPYGSDVFQNIENSGFYEKLADWIETNSDNDIFPILKKGMEATDVSVTTTGYAFSVTEDTAQYQIQLKLKYMKYK